MTGEITVEDAARFNAAADLFNAWLVTLDALVVGRSKAAADAAQAATEALKAHLDAHPDAENLAPIRQRMIPVLAQLKAYEPPEGQTAD
jgi:hypothetical protein